jgi:hypothetical protein
MISGAAGALAAVMVALVVEHGVQYLFATARFAAPAWSTIRRSRLSTPWPRATGRPASGSTFAT